MTVIAVSWSISPFSCPHTELDASEGGLCLRVDDHPSLHCLPFSRCLSFSYHCGTSLILSHPPSQARSTTAMVPSSGAGVPLSSQSAASKATLRHQPPSCPSCRVSLMVCSFAVSS